MLGRIHSIETCGTVDGPGIRFILFTQGCPLRCQYCHNPDSWKVQGGEEMDTEKLIKDVIKYKPYMRNSGGGITISGGEPLLQPDFVQDMFKKCKDEGIHTCLDTSGFVKLNVADPVLDYTDLVLLDIKSYNPDVFKDLTGIPLDPTLAFAEHLNERGIPVWIRYVLVPNLTDNLDDIEELAKYLTTLKNVERIDILPFHKMGEFKWEELGYDYKLKDTQSPEKELVDQAKTIFKNHKLPIFGADKL
ncbi:MAG: pyruvate formate-lyase 1-activating enzyme [Epulopiscium sp. Nele67-Bin004]|nr:MAG: pyruvate formate-lyase 1-activating enzyme [Epulopiscium sp. Nele67-Bin004]